MKIIQIIKTLSGKKDIPKAFKQYFTDPTEKVDYIHILGLSDDGDIYERKFALFIDVPSQDEIKNGKSVVKQYKWTKWEKID